MRAAGAASKAAPRSSLSQHSHDKRNHDDIVNGCGVLLRLAAARHVQKVFDAGARVLFPGSVIKRVSAGEEDGLEGQGGWRGRFG